MHELGLTQNLIEIALEHAEREGARTISSLVLEIGTLSGVIPEAVEFAFEACSQGTIAAGATLEIRHVPGIGHCPECGEQTQLESLTDCCSHCGGYGLEILQGQEMALIEMEID